MPSEDCQSDTCVISSLEKHTGVVMATTALDNSMPGRLRVARALALSSNRGGIRRAWMDYKHNWNDPSTCRSGRPCGNSTGKKLPHKPSPNPMTWATPMTLRDEGNVLGCQLRLSIGDGVSDVHSPISCTTDRSLEKSNIQRR